MKWKREARRENDAKVKARRTRILKWNGGKLSVRHIGKFVDTPKYWRRPVWDFKGSWQFWNSQTRASDVSLKEQLDELHAIPVSVDPFYMTVEEYYDKLYAEDCANGLFDFEPNVLHENGKIYLDFETDPHEYHDESSPIRYQAASSQPNYQSLSRVHRMFNPTVVINISADFSGLSLVLERVKGKIEAFSESVRRLQLGYPEIWKWVDKYESFQSAMEESWQMEYRDLVDEIGSLNPDPREEDGTLY